MSDRQLIADLLSALEYHTEQTRPIQFSKVAIEAAQEYLRKPAPPKREPLTNGEIYTAYITATNQTLRAQDERLAFAFARAIEAAHGIKGEE